MNHVFLSCKRRYNKLELFYLSKILIITLILVIYNRFQYSYKSNTFKYRINLQSLLVIDIMHVKYGKR